VWLNNEDLGTVEVAREKLEKFPWQRGDFLQVTSYPPPGGSGSLAYFLSASETLAESFWSPLDKVCKQFGVIRVPMLSYRAGFIPRFSLQDVLPKGPYEKIGIEVRNDPCHEFDWPGASGRGSDIIFPAGGD
jgi:hypothetical protein